jgi:hypothetical protein
MPDPDNSTPGFASAAVMMRQTRLMLPILLLLIAMTTVSMISNFGGFSRELLLNALPQHAVFTAVTIFLFVLILRRGLTELAAITAAGAAVLVAQGSGLLSVRTAPIAIGISCLLAISPRLRRDGVYGIARLFFVICGSLVLPVASTLALIGQQLTVFHTITYDVPAYLADNAYGFSASAALGGAMRVFPAAHRLVECIYGWLPAAVAICYALNVRAGNPNADVLLKAALAAGLVAFILYHFYPAAGPIYAFGADFPDALPDPSALRSAPAMLARPEAPRNCMPSVHLAWALLAVVEARGLAAIWRTIFAAFAGLTAFATIALGEHYIIDLIVAIPFTFAVHATFNSDRISLISRRSAVSIGAAWTLFWFVFLRLWTPPSHLSLVLWALSVATIAAGVVVWLRDISIGREIPAITLKGSEPPHLPYREIPAAEI